MVPFWFFKKGLARVAGESRALALFAYPLWSRPAAKNRASALFARLTFVLSKVSKTAIAGRDPPHEAAAVPCASRTTGHAAQTRYAQTWAALRPRRPAMLGSLYGSKDQRRKPKQSQSQSQSQTKPKQEQEQEQEQEQIFTRLSHHLHGNGANEPKKANNC
ncbi:hypothetical protein ACF3M1_13735 [Luteimonas sp. WGS1318]|uniref:hypothetical protein n=1 Tax=Luteimonas sp. WGS1318 TaxID=3366815 RepID=UPI00372CEAB0